MIHPHINDILNRIEKRLLDLGMPKEDFYKKACISSASFSQWKSGRHEPSTKKLENIADVLGVSMDYLLTGRTNKAKEKTPGTGSLTSFQINVLDAFDSIPPEKQDEALRLLKVLSEQYKQ